MKRDIEALLFATETPLTIQRLKDLLGVDDGKEIRDAVTELDAEYERDGHAFAVVEFGGGWQLASRADYAPLIQRLYRGRRFVRLSRAALEVLAIVAYRQPITRMEIEEIRGVQASGVLATLLERNLVTVLGRADSVGNPILYGTTREFLNHLGLKALHQLPTLPELESLMEDRDGLKQFASQLGAEIDDEDFETVAVHGEEFIVVAPEPAAEDDEPEAGDDPGDDESEPDDAPPPVEPDPADEDPSAREDANDGDRP